MIDLAEKWKSLLHSLSDEAMRKVIYVMGVSDSGKTTFCQFLHDNLAQHFRTAYIDCDPGQSIIGPPTTIGLKLSFQSGQNEKTVYLHFIGATTPRGHLLPTLTGIKKLTEKAIHLGAQRIILDSSGFVADKLGQEFQFHTIDLLQPHHLVILQRSNEISRWARSFERNPAIKLQRLPVSPSVVPRTQEERKAYREQRFKNYFSMAEPRELGWRGMSFHGRFLDFHNPEAWQNVVMALGDAENLVLALGIVQEIDLANKIIRFHSPKFDQAKATFIHFGSIYLNIEGQQLFLPEVKREM